MTVALFVEAVDTIRALGWALVVWIVLLAAVASLALWTVVVAVACACRAVWRGVTAAIAAVQRLSAPELLPEAHEPPHARTAPSWAQPDEEAA
ncbi:MAG: hypothetical protein HOY69_18970 [Streptomyces sp.]|nr:hypothetical protein [Streptomyces sp.]